MSGGDYVLMAASMILFWGLMISGIVLLVRCLGDSGQAGAPAVLINDSEPSLPGRGVGRRAMLAGASGAGPVAGLVAVVLLWTSSRARA